MEQSEEQSKEMSIEQQAEVLANEPNVVYLGDRKVEVYKCRVKQISPVMTLLSRLLKDLGVLDITNDKAMAELEVKTRNPEYILQLIATYMDDIASVASMLCSLSEEEMQDLELDDAMLVLTKVWEVNESFFSNTILPMFAGKGGIVSGESSQN